MVNLCVNWLELGCPDTWSNVVGLWGVFLGEIDARGSQWLCHEDVLLCVGIRPPANSSFRTQSFFPAAVRVSSLEAAPPRPVEPSDGCSPSWHLIWPYEGDSEPELPSSATPRFRVWNLHAMMKDFCSKLLSLGGVVMHQYPVNIESATFNPTLPSISWLPGPLYDTKEGWLGRGEKPRHKKFWKLTSAWMAGDG